MIVEDDSAINDLLAEFLSRAGYETTQAYSGTEARLLLEHDSFSMLILDLMLPGLSGEEIIPLVRKKSNMPIIVLSAKDASSDKINALRAGADDYMTKPFDEGELIARVEAGLRRAGAVDTGAPKLLKYKDIVLDTDSRSVEVGDTPISLTAREFDILSLLMSNPKKVFTKANLFRSVWNDEFFGDDNTVNVHISKIRGKLGDGEYIQTVWGIGFKLAD